MRSKIVKSDFSGLNNLAKAFGDGRVVRVGILGKKSSRKGAKKEAINNAELGAVHEYGSYSRHIPARSWLRMPIHRDSELIAKETGKAAATLVREGSKVGILKLLGVACEAAIQRAFGSRGFGLWKADAPSTIRRKGSDSPLIDTAQLRRSVTSQVGRPV